MNAVSVVNVTSSFGETTEATTRSASMRMNDIFGIHVNRGTSLRDSALEKAQSIDDDDEELLDRYRCSSVNDEEESTPESTSFITMTKSALDTDLTFSVFK